MADSFRDRQKSFEEKFHRDAELQFKVTSRRNKLLGMWLGERLGMTGAELDAYAKSVVVADLEKPGDEDVIAKVMADIADKGANVSEKDIRKKLVEFGDTAKTQIIEELS